MKRTNISKKVLFLLLLAAANMVRGQKYEYVLKTDSTSWDSYHWELEGIMRDHAFVKKVGNEHLLYYSYGNYQIVGRIREENGRLWLTYSEDPNNQILVYDMNLEVGDEFNMKDSVTYVREIRYEYGRKIIVFDYKSNRWFNEPLMFIEGVGRNFMTFDRFGDRDQSYLPCKYDGEDLTYSTDNSHFENCEFITTSTPEFIDKPQLLIYPNPAKDKIIVCTDALQNEPITIVLMDYSGLILKTLSCYGDKMVISTEGLIGGLYLVQMIGQQCVNYKRIIIL